jgi:mRNA turnover protein 4
MGFNRQKVNGDVGLLITSHPANIVTEWFDSFVKTDFPRAGTVAPITFTIPGGTVYSRGGQVDIEDDSPLPHSLEPTLRQLGMPTRLQKGIITLDSDYTVCKEGAELDSKQTRLLKQFGIACAEFRINLVGYWSKKNGDVQILKQANEMDVDQV